MTRRVFAASLLALVGCARRGFSKEPVEPGLRDLPSDPETITPVVKTEAEWKAILPADAYNILRQKGTEFAFTGRYWDNHEAGTYVCAGCGLALFSSEDKFDSGTGWPSFTRPIRPERVKVVRDTSHGMVREEALCARCDGHQGHVFDDGPPPTGRRWCINSASLLFKPRA